MKYRIVVCGANVPSNDDDDIGSYAVKSLASYLIFMLPAP